MLARQGDGMNSSRGLHQEATADLQRHLTRADQLLVSAARDGDTCLVQELLACTETVNINARDRKSGSTSLIMAAAWGHVKVVALLLDKGADPTLHNFEGRSALELSASGEITALLLGGLQNSSSPVQLLQQAAWQGNLPLVSQLLNDCKEIGLGSCNGEGLTTLALAARDIKVFHQLHNQGLLACYSPLEVVTKMVSKGWKVNCCDQQGRTPLHYTAMFNSEISAKIIEMLLMNGARPNAADKHSFTPLHFAVKTKFLEATRLLLTAGANVNQQTYAGHTALHIAASHGDLKLASVLLERGADVRALTHSGLSTLKCAANRELHQLLKNALEVERGQQIKPAHDSPAPQESDSEESDSLDIAMSKKNVIQAEPLRKSSREESSRSSKKTRNSRRHKSASNLRKQQLLFTMHLGLAVAKGSTIDKQPSGQGSKAQSGSYDDDEDTRPRIKPSSAPVRFSPLPSKIPVIAKSGSAGCIDRRDASPVRSKPCLTCVDASPSVGRKASAIPDVVKASIVNLLDEMPVESNADSNPRRYRHRSPPQRKNLSKRNLSESEHFLARNHRPSDGELLFVVKEPVDSETFLKISKPPCYPSLNKSSRSKQAVHFFMDAKQSSGRRPKCRHPYSVSIRAYGKRGKTKAVAKSDSELETSSLASVTGQTVSLLPQAEKTSKSSSRLPRKCKQATETEGVRRGTGMQSITEQLAAMNIHPMSTSSSTNCSSLEASLGVDCLSQSSAASWVYIPQDQNAPPAAAPSAGCQSSRHAKQQAGFRSEDAQKSERAKLVFPAELCRNVEKWKNVFSSGEHACHNSPVIEWTKGKLLGKGAFGMVWCGMTSTGDLIAVKQVKLNTKDSMQASEEYQQIQQEFCMLQKLQHRNIVAYLGTQLEGTAVNIFMQYVAGGSISNNLSQFGSFGEAVIRRYTRQILEGVQYLHGHGIVHRDIKGANIMVMPSETGGFIKLIDFGCAKMLHMSLQDSNHYIQSVRGTPYWMAPEVIQQTDCTEKSDIWSVGCTVIEMATTKPPWYELPPFSAAYAIGQGTSKPVIPENVSPWVKDFIELAMQRDPRGRPMATALLVHPFLVHNSDHGATAS